MTKIREASFDDYQDIKILQNRYGLETKDFQQWQHQWKNNPAIADIKKPWPIGWIIENDNKQIVGYFGNIPLAYEFEAKRLFAAVATSIVVDTNYRKHSISLAKNFFTQEGADLFLGTTTNYEAEKIFQAFKTLKAPAVLYDVRLFWIINYQNFTLSALIEKKLPLSHIIKYPLSLAMWGIDKLIKRNRLIKRLDKEIQLYSTFDERFDIFWDKLRKRYYNRLLCVRNREYLNWHFKHAIAHKKIWIFTLEKNSQITSYAIFLRQDSHRIGLKRIWLVDLQSIDEEPDVVMGMVSAGIERCQGEGVDALEIIGFNRKKRDAIERFNPHKMKSATWPFFYKAKDKLLAERLVSPQAWDPCLFDGDASIL